MGTTFDGDVHIMGRLTMGELVPSAGSIDDAAIAPGGSTPISATKTQRRDRAHYAQNTGTTAADQTVCIHVAHASGTVRAFHSWCKAANTSGATVTFDLKKNGTTILSGGPVSHTDATPSSAVLDGTLNGSLVNYVADDIFEIVIDATVGGGTLATGVGCSMVFDENPS